jgi:hypothetical protein
VIKQDVDRILSDLSRYKKITQNYIASLKELGVSDEYTLDQEARWFDSFCSYAR